MSILKKSPLKQYITGGLMSGIILGILLNIAALIYAAHWLRPASDDYCAGWLTGQSGLLGNIWVSWETINGFITSVFYSNLWVGWPLAHLPLSVASLIPFVVTAVGLGVTILCVVRIFLPLQTHHFFYLLPITAFLWWTFLNVTKTFSKYFLNPNNFFESQIDLMSSGLIFWQTLNGMYILQLVSILIGIAIALDKKVYGSKLFGVYLILLGTFSGMTGPTLTVSILVLIFFFAIVHWLCASRTSIIFYLYYLIFCFSTSAGLFLSLFLSPGNKNRQFIIGADYNFSTLDFKNIINDAFQFGLILWLKCYLAIGAIFVFIFITTFIATHSKLLRISSSKLVITGLLFSLFALLQMIINRASEYFAYQGYWHFVSALACIFLSLIFFGAALGLGISQKLPIKKVQSFNVAVLFGLLAIASFSNYSMIESIF